MMTTTKTIGSALWVASYWAGAVGADENLIKGNSPCRWVISVTGGTLVCANALGSTLTVALPAGVPVPLSLSALTAAGSTATDITVLW